MLLLAEGHKNHAHEDPIGHVIDKSVFEFFDTIGLKVHLPEPLTKYILMELITAGLLFALFIPLARRIASGEPLRGRFGNALEFLLLFIRDQVARPSIGEHDYRRFMPLLWTFFLFILVLNLLGLVPFLASATASLAVTIPLAFVSFVVIHYNGVVANHGVVGYLKTFIPHIDTSDKIMKIMGPPLLVMMFVLEVFGAVIRAVVLAVRLFANMLAGHTAVIVLLGFIPMVGNMAAEGSAVAGYIFWPVSLGTTLVVTAMSMLELFVAFLQAFVFTFLTAIFIGLAMHPQH